MAPIFISYRRDDAAGHARALEQALARQFGAERVFIDVDDIVAGEAFEQRLRSAVQDARVVLVLIGRRWRGERPERPDLPPRLFDAGDFVHREVATALAAGVPVLPVLLDDTPMPGVADLPADLHALPGLHALGLDHKRFAADIERLVTALQSWVPLGATSSPVPADRSRGSPAVSRRRAAALAAAATALAAAAWWLTQVRPGAGIDGASAAGEARAGVHGTWVAEVPYAWLREPQRERFVFSGEGDRLSGTASFLGVDRGVQEGRLEADGTLQFVIRTRETDGGSTHEVLHRYRGVFRADGIHFEMQTEGASQPHAPLHFVARRMAAPDRAAASR